MNYYEKCMAEEESWDNIDKYIDAWHESTSDKRIYDYLGLPRDIYYKWVEGKIEPQHINFAIQDRDFADYLISLFGSTTILSKKESK